MAFDLCTLFQHDNATSSVKIMNDTTAVSAASDADIGMVRHFFYLYLSLPVVFVGICGNVLNLVTLHNRQLQTEPFMYIRAMAVFDLLALLLVIGASLRNSAVITPRAGRIDGMLLAWYQVGDKCAGANSH